MLAHSGPKPLIANSIHDIFVCDDSCRTDINCYNNKCTFFPFYSMGLRRSAFNSENIGLINNSIKHALGRNIDGKNLQSVF